VPEGAVGAGTGARAGGLQGGIGGASTTLPSGATVAALAVFNASGHVIDPSSGLPWEHAGTGLRRPPAVERRALVEHIASITPPLNTTIGVVATDAVLSKAECRKFASVAHNGLARAVRPSHLLFDGDTIFRRLHRHAHAARGRAAARPPAAVNALIAAAADLFRHRLHPGGRRGRVGARRPALLPGPVSRSLRPPMKTLRTPQEALAWSEDHRRAGRTIGMVPTMGALHGGHLALFAEAARLTDVVVVSIFVNPLQFDRPDDFARYPAPVRRRPRRGEPVPGSTPCTPRRRRRCTPPATPRPSTPATWPRAWRAPPDRGTSPAWPPWSPSCSPPFARTSPCSAPRTSSSWLSSGGWPPTSTSASTSSACRRSARTTGWRCPAATSG